MLFHIPFVLIVCSTYAQECTIRTIEAHDGIVKETVFNAFRKENPEPIVIQNLISQWRAIKEWQSADEFLSQYGDMKVAMLSQVVAGRSSSYKGETAHAPSFREYLTNDDHADRIQFAFNNLDVQTAASARM